MTTQTKSVPLWSKLTGVAFSLAAAIAMAFMNLSDTNVMRNVLVTDNRLASTLAYLTLGGWIGTLAFIVYNRLFGTTLDTAYTGIRGISRKSQLLAIGSGLAGALSTVFYLYAAGDGDPSIIIALSGFSLVYLAIYDGWKIFRAHNNATPLAFGFVAALTVGIGSAFATMETKPNGTLFIDAATIGRMILLLLVLNAGFSAVSSIFKDIAIKKERTSAVNFSFWRFLWLAIFGSILAVAYAYANGIFAQYANILLTKGWQAAPWILLALTFAYGNNVFTALAQRDLEVSKVYILASLQAVLAAPLTIWAVQTFPGKFTAPELDSLAWLYRGLGAALIFTGLALSLYFKPNKQGKEK